MNDAQTEKQHSGHFEGRFSQEKTEEKVDTLAGQKAAEVIREGAADDAEAAENVDGKVSEDLGEDKKQGSAGGGSASLTDEQKEELRSRLLSAVPPQEVMINQIRKKLGQQEDDLIKKIAQVKGRAHRNAYKLTILVQQLRLVRTYLRQLARATYELVKHLWLKIVHGV